MRSPAGRGRERLGWGSGRAYGYKLPFSELPDQWSWLDEFEGPGYERVAVSARTEESDVVTSLYVLGRL